MSGKRTRFNFESSNNPIEQLEEQLIDLKRKNIKTQILAKIDSILPDKNNENMTQSEIASQNKPTGSKLKYNRYDKGPYIIITEKRDINVYKLSKDLKTIGITNVMEIDQINKRKARISFNYWYDANKMIENDCLVQKEYSSFIPEMFVYTVGVVRGIPLDISIKDITDNHECSLALVKVERITRWVNESQTTEDTESVKLTFRAKTIPDKIKIFNINSKIDYFVPNPIFCTKCHNYGHKFKFCKGLGRCKVCAELLPNSLEVENGNTHDCSQEINCKHCGPGHKTNDLALCNERKRQRKINRYMVVHKLSYIEANKKLAKPISNIPTDEDFPTPVWGKTNTPKNPSQNKSQLNIATKTVDDVNTLKLRTELDEYKQLLDSIQQMISNGSGAASNDMILYEIGVQCRKSKEKLSKPLISKN